MSSSGRKIILKSSDGESFEVDEAVALESQTIKHMIEDDCADNGIPLPNVTSKILAKVIEYCKKHVEAPKTDDRTAEDELKSWDADFVKVDQATLFDLILAANYLNIKGLLDLTCQTVADMIKGKTPEEIRKTFNIKNDFTPEEEEEEPDLAKTFLKSSFAYSPNNLRASLTSDSIGVSFPVSYNFNRWDGIPCLVPRDGKIVDPDETMKDGNNADDSDGTMKE
ncbi:hypothetical protein DITRI_Ditri16bG0005300 [Diplodiscus trichospermus]